MFAQRLGLDPAAFLQVARGCASYSQVMDIKGAKMVRGDFVAEGRVTQHSRMCTSCSSRQRGCSRTFRCSRSMREVLEACVRHGEGDLDNSIVVEEDSTTPARGDQFFCGAPIDLHPPIGRNTSHPLRMRCVARIARLRFR